MRLGIKGFVGLGGGQHKKESTLSKAVTLFLFAAAIAMLIYCFTR
jgi:hypothetical protein